MKKCILFVIFAIVLCGCQMEKDKELSEYGDTFGKAQQIAAVSADSAKVEKTITTREELDEFVSALNVDEWESGEPSHDSKVVGSFGLSQEKTIKLGQVDTDGKLYDVGKIILYDSPYIKFEIAGFEMTFQIPEETEKYLKSYFEFH